MKKYEDSDPYESSKRKPQKNNYKESKYRTNQSSLSSDEDSEYGRDSRKPEKTHKPSVHLPKLANSSRTLEKLPDKKQKSSRHNSYDIKFATPS